MKEQQIILDIYKDLYLNADPSANFNQLLETAKANNSGIPYMDYQISQEKEEAIFKKHLVNKRITKLKQQAFRNTVLLGVAPKHKNK